jgi:hypothetical protein
MARFWMGFMLGAKCMPVVAFGLATLLAGCGEKGPARQDVSGKVTFNGIPVPAGQIVFEPDSAAGNKGPAGFAEIRDGQYDTAGAQGTVGGPHVARITGLEARPVGNATVNPLFNTYEARVDLGQEASTQDFDVPVTAANGLKPSNEPPP